MKVLACLIGWVLMFNPLPGESSEPSSSMISVGTHRLQVHIAGEGTPAVIIDAGLGDTLDRLRPLQERLAQSTLVVTYNRAGYGGSESGPLPRHSGREAEELKVLLDGASVPGVFWKTILTPSTVSSSISSSMTMVGAISVTLPAATFWARPWPAWPKGLAGSRMPYW